MQLDCGIWVGNAMEGKCYNVHKLPLLKEAYLLQLQAVFTPFIGQGFHAVCNHTHACTDTTVQNICCLQPHFAFNLHGFRHAQWHDSVTKRLRACMWSTSLHCVHVRANGHQLHGHWGKVKFSLCLPRIQRGNEWYCIHANMHSIFTCTVLAQLVL